MLKALVPPARASVRWVQASANRLALASAADRLAPAWRSNHSRARRHRFPVAAFRVRPVRTPRRKARALDCASVVAMTIRARDAPNRSKLRWSHSAAWLFALQA